MGSSTRLMMIFALGLCLAVVGGTHEAALPSGARFLPGPVNGLRVNGKALAYGDSGGRVKEASHVLFTHARRDVAWAGEALVKDGSAAAPPERERSLLSKVVRLNPRKTKVVDPVEPAAKKAVKAARGS